MTIISRSDRDGIAVLVWDQPGASVNSARKAALDELVSVMDAVLQDDEVTGIVLASGKKGFVAGGDLRELQATRTEDDVRALVADAAALNRRMETAGKPIVAAVNGAALGGGLELALACHGGLPTPTPFWACPRSRWA